VVNCESGSDPDLPKSLDPYSDSNNPVPVWIRNTSFTFKYERIIVDGGVDALDPLNLTNSGFDLIRIHSIIISIRVTDLH
jgi:hypothetical protein